MSLEQRLRLIKLQRLTGGFNKLLQAPCIDAVSSFNFSVDVNNKFWSRIPALEHDADSVLRDFPELPVQFQFRLGGSTEKPLISEELWLRLSEALKEPVLQQCE